MAHQNSHDDRGFRQPQLQEVKLSRELIDTMQSAAIAYDQGRFTSPSLMHNSKIFIERRIAAERSKNCLQRHSAVEALVWPSLRPSEGHRGLLLHNVEYSQPAEQRNLFAREGIRDKVNLLDSDEMLLPRWQELHEGKTLLISGTWVTRRSSSEIEIWANVLPITFGTAAKHPLLSCKFLMERLDMSSIQSINACSENDPIDNSSRSWSFWQPSRSVVVRWEYLEALAEMMEVGND